MFLGHFALAFAAKRAAPRASLGTLIAAAQFADLLWPTLLLVGLERVRIAPGVTRVTPLDFEHYPFSHSLLAVAGWALAFALAYALLRGGWKVAGRAALVLAALVLSHWLLDALVHRPDLPLWPGGGARVGAGVWNSLPLTLAVELVLFGAGVWIYLLSTEALDRVGRWAPLGLVLFLLVVFAGNLFGPPPPSVEAIAWAGHAQWLFVAWGCWIDRHRRARPLDGARA